MATIHVLETPKKSVKRKGPQPKTDCKDDYCRVCNVNFKIQFGSSKCSTENLYKQSDRKESKGLILTNAWKRIGLGVHKSDHLSHRVCRPCGRKIRNAVDNYDFLKTHLETRSQSELGLCDSVNEDETTSRQKRQLSTTVTPERRASTPKIARAQNRKSRKHLFSDTSYEDAVQNVMNIDSFDEGKSRSQVRVIISYPNRDITVKQSFDQTTDSLLRNIALKNWVATANIIFNHPEITGHIPMFYEGK